MMTNNNNFNSSNTNNSADDAFPKQFLNYINYELSLFEKITHKKFSFNILSNNRFELSVCETKDEEEDYSDNEDNKSKYQVIYRANDLNQFIKRLFMIREHLIKNFGNGITAIT